MLWMTLRWNLGNTLPIAAFCLLSIITIGEAWSTSPADVGPLPRVYSESTATAGGLPADLRQPAAALALSTN
jgi:hypothetical protein